MDPTERLSEHEAQELVRRFVSASKILVRGFVISSFVLAAVIIGAVVFASVERAEIGKKLERLSDKIERLSAR